MDFEALNAKTKLKEVLDEAKVYRQQIKDAQIALYNLKELTQELLAEVDDDYKEDDIPKILIGEDDIVFKKNPATEISDCLMQVLMLLRTHGIELRELALPHIKLLASIIIQEVDYIMERREVRDGV